jgi:hypothetical protein
MGGGGRPAGRAANTPGPCCNVEITESNILSFFSCAAKGAEVFTPSIAKHTESRLHQWSVEVTLAKIIYCTTTTTTTSIFFQVKQPCWIFYMV